MHTYIHTRNVYIVWLEVASLVLVGHRPIALSSRPSPRCLDVSATACRLGHRPVALTSRPSLVVSAIAPLPTKMKRGSASTDPAIDKRRRMGVERELLSNGHVTRGALVECLLAFQDAGLLSADMGSMSKASLKLEVQGAIEHHSRTMTPFGTVIQSMDLGTEGLKDWQHINPLAYLYHLSSISKSFATMMKDCIKDPATPLRLILYIDEVNPGNPLRPDKGRSTQAIYWCFADWPAWALQRSGVWLLFGVVRSSLVAALPAGESQLMRRVLNVFFPKTGSSFAHQILLCDPGGGKLICTATFAGFLADEKAHKEILEAKGASGTKPCVSCKNIVQKLSTITDDSIGYLRNISCIDYHALDPHTNASWFEMADMLEKEKPVLGKAAFAKLEQTLGLSYNAEGLMWDQHLRTIIRPVDNCIRDWMHTLVSGGVAGTEMSLLLQALHMVGVSYDQVQQYAIEFVLPKSRGKLDPSCWTAGRISDDQLRSSASEQLNMVPILFCFLEDVIKPTGALPEHIKCFALLRGILEILSLGPHQAMSHIGALKASIIAHGKLFRVLYQSSVKPKFHHMLHLHDGMMSVGACLGCFVTERKHREVKGAACHIFRHFEYTVLVDLVNRQAEDFRCGVGFDGLDLVKPNSIIVNGKHFRFSRQCMLLCGETCKDDVVALSGKRLGKVLGFWAEQQPSPEAIVDRTSSIAVQILLFRRVPGDGNTWSMEKAGHSFVSASDLMAPVVYAPLSETTIRAVLPSVWYSA
jgi:hypothetical protein